MKVAILQVVCPTYKVEIFKALYELKELDIDYFIGDKNNSAVAGNASEIPFPYKKVKNIFFRFLGVEWLFQRGFPLIGLKKYDLVIIPLSVPNFLNYIVLVLAKLFKVRVGFYGMGLNYQRRFSRESSFLEKLRMFLMKNADFTVVYTEEIKNILVSLGVNNKKLYVAPNTLGIEKINEQQVNVDKVKCKLGIKPGELLIAFVGRLSKQKNPSLLLDVLQLLKTNSYSAKLVFVGDGDELNTLKDKSANDGDVIFLGSQPENVATEVLKSADFSIMPGMAGLAVVHSFVCKTVFITVEDKLHSPEFGYIDNGLTGIVIEPSALKIYETIINLVENPRKKIEIENNAYNYVMDNLSLKSQIHGFKSAIQSVGNIK